MTNPIETAGDLQEIRAALRAAYDATNDVNLERVLLDAIAKCDGIEEVMVEADLIPVV